MNIKNKLLLDLGLEEWFVADDVAGVPENYQGDFAIPCFKLSKERKKAPALIATEFCENYQPKGVVESVVAVGAYINVVLCREKASEFVCNRIISNPEFGKNDSGKDKTVCIDYSSITLSKQIHIGHLCTTVIGECLAKLFENAGYKVVRINYLGDMGTPFGKIITVYKCFGDGQKIEEMNAYDVQRLYALFAEKEKEDDTLIEKAREWSLKIENKDEEAVTLCNAFISIALKEAKDMYAKLNIDFDDWRGEAFYNTQTEKVIQMLKDKNLLVESEGALCVDLNDYDMGMCLIQRSDGGTLYTTRDLAAAIDRYNCYSFDESLYVTGIEQKHHFQSFYKVLELAGYEWAKNLKHIGYGRMSTEYGKISGREGHTPIVKEIFDASVEKANAVLQGRDVSENTADAIGIGAVVFSVLRTERLKDTVFSLDQAINFDGNTSVYIQYSDVRLKTIISKTNIEIEMDARKTTKLVEDDEVKLILKLDEFEAVLDLAQKEFEPCHVARYALELSSLVNKFYNNIRVITEDSELTGARLILCKLVNTVLEKVMYILGIRVIDKM